MNQVAKNFIFIGVPGAGKGTFSNIFVKNLGWKTLSLGDLLRAEVKSKSQLGKELDEFMSKGLLIPDDIATKIAIKAVNEAMASNKTVILDGYPRTVSQAQSLTKTGIKFTAVDINLERSIAVDKLLSRVNCSKCGKGFNTSEIMTDGYVMPALLPTKTSCPNNHEAEVCTALFEKRDDDTLDTINQRFDEYERKTAPVLKYFEDLNMLKTFKVKRGVDDADDLLKYILS